MFKQINTSDLDSASYCMTGKHGQFVKRENINNGERIPGNKRKTLSVFVRKNSNVFGLQYCDKSSSWQILISRNYIPYMSWRTDRGKYFFLFLIHVVLKVKTRLIQGGKKTCHTNTTSVPFNLEYSYLYGDGDIINVLPL